MHLASSMCANKTPVTMFSLLITDNYTIRRMVDSRDNNSTYTI